MRLSLMNGYWTEIEQHLCKALDKPVSFVKRETISGGCINQTWKVVDKNNNEYFVKTNSPDLKDMFVAEAKGLEEIENSNSILTPDVLVFGSTSHCSYLVLEYLSLKSQINQKRMGEQLAQMHLYSNPSKKYSNQFGWEHGNHIGSTPQTNSYNTSWVSFWKNERLLYQLNLAKSKGYSHKAYDDGLKLADSVGLFFTSHQVDTSLLHGDLWGGNCASDVEGNPVIYDPAVYYGDREADIAMTELFGGFNSDFYKAYNAHFRLDSGYKTRKTLYNLYHILNHFNLFGDSYAFQAESMTKQLLSEI